MEWAQSLIAWFDAIGLSPAGQVIALYATVATVAAGFCARAREREYRRLAEQQDRLLALLAGVRSGANGA